MTKVYQDESTNGYFVLHRSNPGLCGKGIHKPSTINTFVFNQGEPQQVYIDEVAFTIPSQCILPLVSNQHFVFEKPETLSAWQFNREFYCIVDHDAELGCAGFFFFGIQHPMFIKLDAEHAQDIVYLEHIFSKELMRCDYFQGEMLRALLKRLLISGTRIAK